MVYSLCEKRSEHRGYVYSPIWCGYVCACGRLMLPFGRDLDAYAATRAADPRDERDERRNG